MSYIILDNKVTTLDIPLISVPTEIDNEYLLCKNGDDFTWKSANIKSSTGIIQSEELSELTKYVYVTVNVTDTVNFINTDGLLVSNGDKVNSIYQSSLIKVEDYTRFSIKPNRYSSISQVYLT